MREVQNSDRLAVAVSVKRSILRGWIRDRLGIDQSVLFAVSARIWSSAAGLVTIGLIARYLSAAEQGYFYTFASLVALQVVFELGFSFVIMQLTSHERAHLEISSDYTITGDLVAHARLASILQKTVRWYTTAAGLMLVSIIPAGLWFFESQGGGTGDVSWYAPWCCAVVAAALNLQFDPLLSFFEGCGFVRDITRLRLIQSMVGSSLSWVALASHSGLFAPALNLAGIAITSTIWLYRRRSIICHLWRFEPGGHRIDWKSEVWSFQWRIAISWLCGYFTLQIFNPLLFAFRGAVAAGQMGMSLTIVMALQGVSWSWMTTKVASFGAMVARNERAQLNHMFIRTLQQALGVHLSGAAVILIGAIIVDYADLWFSRRILSAPLLALLLAATTINIIVFAESTYLRVHKVEKFLLNSVLTSLSITVLAYACGRQYGASGMVVIYVSVVAGISLTLGTATFVAFWRSYHPK